MFCQYCGREIDDSARFCDYCGRRQPESTPIGKGPAAGGAAGEPERAPSELRQEPIPHEPSVIQEKGDSGRAGRVEPAGARADKSRGGAGSKVAIGIIVLVVVIAIAWAIFGSFNKTDTGGADEGQPAVTSEESSPASTGEEDAGTETASSGVASEEGSASAVTEDSDEGDTADEEEESVEASSDPRPGKREASEAHPKREHVGFRGINSATASSYLPHDDFVNTSSYEAGMALDGDVGTCWAEGSSGSGVGESITLRGKGRQTFSGFTIYAGYQKSKYTYRINARPKKLRVYADGRLVASPKLRDAGLRSQRVDFSPVDAKSLTIEISSVYRGTKWSDCCISEIQCF